MSIHLLTNVRNASLAIYSLVIPSPFCHKLQPRIQLSKYSVYVRESYHVTPALLLPIRGIRPVAASSGAWDGRQLSHRSRYLPAVHTDEGR